MKSIFCIQMILLFFSGLLAGVIDSIAGGGGLITLPSLTLILGPGPHAIGTNKIVGTVAALVALLVYRRAGHFDLKKSLFFAISVGVGSFVGSRTAILLPLWVFRWFLLVSCPVVLWVVWRKDLWLAWQGSSVFIKLSQPKIAAVGVLCGFYDGVWGPGGGTFMFLALVFVADLPLLTGLAAAKLANTLSASSALFGYALGGYVHWGTSVPMVLGISLGAFVGAKLAVRRASVIMRPILVVVVVLLLIRVFQAN
ncbi:TSUP family transporter [Bdellovibrionota bacterium FG-2]